MFHEEHTTITLFKHSGVAYGERMYAVHNERNKRGKNDVFVFEDLRVFFPQGKKGGDVELQKILTRHITICFSLFVEPLRQ